MPINFPASPNVNDTFTEGSITYKCLQNNPTKWIGLGTTPVDRLVEGSNNLEINSNNLVWTGNNVGIGGGSPDDLLSIKKSSSTAYDATAIQSGGARLSIFNSNNTLSDTFADIHFKCHSTSSGEARIGMELPSINNSELFFITENNGNLVERLRITSAGNVSISDGNLVVANGHGIDFSDTGDSSGTMLNELLDDYEEGTWTPNPNGAGTINGTNITYAGYYTKVGRVVHLEFFANNSAGDIEIPSYKVFSGLPFTAASGNYGTGRICTEDGEQLDRQGDIILGGSNFLINKCGSSSGTVRLSGNVTYIAT